MTCINKFRKFGIIVAIVLVLSIILCGCDNSEITYSIYDNSKQYNLINNELNTNNNLFASDLCVADGSNLGLESVDSTVAGGAIIANRDKRQINYSQNIFQKMYPASTTKILTALICIRYANLDEYVTVSENACKQTKDSSIAGLNPGDRITYRQLLYGLMLASGNDAAIAIAEGMSGSVQEFSKLMNNEAVAVGATKSNFITPNGLHDENHYTTVYDMYLIFNEALKYQLFNDIISTPSFEAFYTDVNGNPVRKTWNNTNKYLTKNVRMPKGITVIGGKTGTTNPAGYCLVLLSRNENNEQIISIVYNADCVNNLYHLMNQILANFGSK